MPPSNAKRMTGGVGVYLVTLVGIDVGCRPEKLGSESHRLLVCNPRIFDVEIEVNLLGAAVRPVGGDVVGCELYADPPLASRINDAMPTLVLEDAASKDPGPECALRMDVRCVEHNDLTHHSHDRIIETAFAGGQPRPPARAFWVTRPESFWRPATVSGGAESFAGILSGCTPRMNEQA
jgi:hypothetical protein